MSAMVVYDEGRGWREVRGFCEACQTSVSHGNHTRRMTDVSDVQIVSPRGVAHATHEDANDRTACGKDATGDRWWHRI